MNFKIKFTIIQTESIEIRNMHSISINKTFQIHIFAKFCILTPKQFQTNNQTNSQHTFPLTTTSRTKLWPCPFGLLHFPKISLFSASESAGLWSLWLAQNVSLLDKQMVAIGVFCKNLS